MNYRQHGYQGVFEAFQMTEERLKAKPDTWPDWIKRLVIVARPLGGKGDYRFFVTTIRNDGFDAGHWLVREEGKDQPWVETDERFQKAYTPRPTTVLKKPVTSFSVTETDPRPGDIRRIKVTDDMFRTEIDHSSDCREHNAPAFPKKDCNGCEAEEQLFQAGASFAALYCGDNARRWARYFHAAGPQRDLETGWAAGSQGADMIGWFANAIETACSKRGKK